MPVLSGAASTYSDFPTGLDAFTRARDGTGSSNVLTAVRWNELMSSLYLLEAHTRQNAHTIGTTSKRKLSLVQIVTLPDVSGTAYATFTVTAEQKLYLGGTVWQPGGMLLADVGRYDLVPEEVPGPGEPGGETSGSVFAYTTDIDIEPPDSVIVLFQQLNYDAEAPNDSTYRMTAGSYRVRLTILTP